MENCLLEIMQGLSSADTWILYLLLFVSAVVENLFPPIPGDTITAFGAFLVGTGRLNYFMVYFSTTLGSVAGFILLFAVGRLLGKSFFTDRNYRFLSREKILEAEGWFNRYGYFAVLANHFLPGVRYANALVPGISGLSPLKVALTALLSASVWNLIWIQAGYTLGNNWDTVSEKLRVIMRNYNVAVALLMAAVLLAFLLYRRRTRRRS